MFLKIDWRLLAVLALFALPFSVVLADEGQQVFSFALQYSTLGHENGCFNEPKGMAFSPDGNYLAVCDTHSNRIQLFSVDSAAYASAPLLLERV